APRQRKNVIKKFKQHFRPALVAAGSDWLRRKLLAHGLEQVPEGDILDLFIEEASAALRKRKHHPHIEREKSAHDWWIQQFGILASRNRGLDLPHALLIDDKQAEMMVGEILKTVERAQLTLIQELNVPPALQSRIDRILPCERCHPQIPGDNVGKLEDRVLRLHRRSAPCGKGGVAVFRQHQAPRPQYFLVEFTNRIGVAAEIFTVFSRFHVDITDHAGCRLQRGWSVVRLQVELIEDSRVEQLAESLEKIDGVRRVIKPNQPVVPLLENVLPHRRSTQSSFLIPPPPYICGNCITDDAYFYGMESELAQLNDVFGRITAPGGQKGSSVFVHGPKRSGKSSLVLYFFRQIQRLNPQKCLMLYYEASRRQTWGGAEREIHRQICEQAEQMASFFRVTLPTLADLSLVELMEALQRLLNIPFVLIIDEAIGLLSETTDEGERERLLDFFDCVAKLPRRMVIWVGPEAPLPFLDDALRRKLEKAEMVKTRPVSLADTFALLRADKFSYCHHIRISRTLCRQIHTLTAGHPYWISFLGRSMWQAAQPHQGEVLRYTPQLLERAVKDLLHIGIPFTDRLYSTLAPKRLYSKILEVLAQETIQDKGMQLSDLLHTLTTEDLDISANELNGILNMLQAQGTLDCLYGERCAYWRLSAPLLGMYIRFRQSQQVISGDFL
ncbi:AAA family ATPase, partial [candidate division KSB1 bacterium]|nr:AAA family ATPase [candidate division KSB1 bacterium]